MFFQGFTLAFCFATSCLGSKSFYAIGKLHTRKIYSKKDLTTSSTSFFFTIHTRTHMQSSLTLNLPSNKPIVKHLGPKRGTKPFTLPPNGSRTLNLSLVGTTFLDGLLQLLLSVVQLLLKQCQRRWQ